MCVIISQPPKQKLTREVALAAWKQNADGGGFAYIDRSNEIKTEKYMEFDKFWARYTNQVAVFPDSPFMIHFRIATHGKVCIDNTHPISVNEHTVMAHNGIIQGVPTDRSNEKSDSRLFAELVLPELPTDWLDKPWLVRLVEDWVGWSKLMFLTVNPALKKNVYILNEESGDGKADSWWFSNVTGMRNCKTLPIEAKPINVGSYRTSQHYESYYDDYDINGDYLDYLEKRQTQAPSPILPLSTRGVEKKEEQRNHWSGYIDDKLEELLDENEYDDLQQIASMEDLEDICTMLESPDDFSAHEHLETGILFDIRDLRKIGRRRYEKLRLQEGFLKKIVVSSESIHAYPEPGKTYLECLGCDEAVEELTGLCRCYERYCLDCMYIAGQCQCPTGWSNNLKTLDSSYQPKSEEEQIKFLSPEQLKEAQTRLTEALTR